MGTWSETRQPTQIDGLEVPVSSRKLTGGRRVASRAYWGRDGAGSEDGGRTARRVELQIPLFNSLDPSHYPDLRDSLIDAFTRSDRGGQPIPYVDAEEGPFEVTLDGEWSWLEEPGKRDGGVLTVALKEDGLDNELFRIVFSDAEGAAREHALALDTGLEDVGIAEADAAQLFEGAGVKLSGEEADYAAGSFWTHQIDTFLVKLEDALPDADELGVLADSYRRRASALLESEALDDPGQDAAAMTHALVQWAAAMTDLAERQIAALPPIVEYTTRKIIGPEIIALELYGDPERADEILRRNPVASWLYPRGATLQVLSR